MSAAVRVTRADLADAADAAALVDLLDAYARDPMGGGVPLAAAVRARLPGDLAVRPGTHVFIARCAGAPAGLAICFEGYSTFAGAPLLNIHDFAVVPARRGQGVGRALLAAVETAAQALGCCKITLEVLSGNGPAQALYVSAGFAPYALDPAIGHALLMQKPLGAK